MEAIIYGSEHSQIAGSSRRGSQGRAPPFGSSKTPLSGLCQFQWPETGMVVDLSELLDLHEDGFAVQTSERLEMNRAVTLCLDLPETRKFIHGTGQVIWSDDAGRGGIRFSALPESSRQVLKEWLFANLLIACSNHAARTEQLAQREREDEEKNSADLAPATKAGSVVPISDGSRLLSSVEAVRHEIQEIGDDIDAILQLIAERALSLTGASGAALALAADYEIICRARAGEPAPPLGAPVDVKQGCPENAFAVASSSPARMRKTIRASIRKSAAPWA